MKTTVSSKGQIVLPAELRDQDRIRPGQQFAVERLQAGRYALQKLPPLGQPSVLDWLNACPEWGWFRPLPSESTAEL
jgi:AbrB family looped-hinge helix DNA binding protein